MFCTAGTKKYWHYLRWHREYCDHSQDQTALNKPSILRSMKYISTICAPMSIISCPLFCRTRSQMVPRVGGGARWGQLEYLYLDYWQYFGKTYCESRSISRFCTADTARTPSTSGFDTAGTACTRCSVLLKLPVLAVFGH